MSQAATAQIAEMHYDPDCSPEQIAAVLSSLDRWSGRTAKHVTHQRSSPRHDYRTSIVIEPEGNEARYGLPRQVFQVPTRNVSQTGLGLVVPPVFMPRMLSDETPLVRAEATFRLGMKIKLTLGSAGTTMRPLVGEIVRVRPIHQGFLEVGVRFHDRATCAATGQEADAAARQGGESCASS